MSPKKSLRKKTKPASPAAPKRPLSIDALLADYRDVQLATLVTDVPRGETWSYELKYDGYRILALKSGAEVRLMSRNQQDWTREFAAVAADVAKLAVPGCVLDGEVCALDDRGRPSFQRLQNRARGARLAYFVFDLLYEGEDLRPLPLEERRLRLGRCVSSKESMSSVVLSSAAHGDGATVLRTACANGFEGVVAKELGARYTPGRSRTWLKIKCTLRQEFAIVGWLPLATSERAIGSLLLALAEADGSMRYAGKVGTGFDMKMRADLGTLLRRDERKEPTAIDVPRFGGAVHFVKPKHVAEVAFSEWTGGGHVRHPSFQGLRADKRPEECVREAPAKP
jgi:bifunctional non-homologous end joining protein LigD